MARIPHFRMLTLNLEGKVDPDSRAFLPAEYALEKLKKETGVDHGKDVAAWRAYLKEKKLK